MRKIKPAKKPRETRIECDDCGAIYAVKRAELKFQSDCRDGDYYWFTCPDCKSKSTIAAELVK